MDLLLHTNDDARYLALLGVQRLSDGSGLCAQLAVRSGTFAAQLHFCVEPELLQAFVAALEGMDVTLHGAARLSPRYEESFLSFEVHHTGAVAVSGALVRYAEHTHRLQFGFHTDQTCLGPFARDLRACLLAPAV